MKKHALILLILILALTSCRNDISLNSKSDPQSQIIVSTPTPASSSQIAIPTPSAEPEQAIEISTTIDNNTDIIAKYETANFDKQVYITANETLYDISINTVMNINGFAGDIEIEHGVIKYVSYRTSPAGRMEDYYVESDILLYVPMLEKGQAISIPDEQYYNKYHYGYCRIAYTNSAGEHEMFLLTKSDGSSHGLIETEPQYINESYDEYLWSNSSDFLWYKVLFPDDFSEKMIAGDFDAYIPKGFCIMSGSLGDVNNDGITDALICLITNSVRRDNYNGVIPILILLGRPDGLYTITQKISISDATQGTGIYLLPYLIAGNGYIEIIYPSYNERSHGTKFWYDDSKKDWLLKELYRESAISPYVRALPDFADLPLSEFTNRMFYFSLPDWEYFDATETLTTFSLYEGDYTIGLKINEETGFYEGYIYSYNKIHNNGGFIQTIRGEYKSNSEFTITNTSNNEVISFKIQTDKWRLTNTSPSRFVLSAW